MNKFQLLKDVLEKFNVTAPLPEEIKRRFLKYCPSTAFMPAFQELSF